MKVEYDKDNAETILHLDSDEMGLILFAFDLAELESSNPQTKEQLYALRTNIREGMKK